MSEQSAAVHMIDHELLGDRVHAGRKVDGLGSVATVARQTAPILCIGLREERLGDRRRVIRLPVPFCPNAAHVEPVRTFLPVQVRDLRMGCGCGGRVSSPKHRDEGPHQVRRRHDDQGTRYVAKLELGETQVASSVWVALRQ